MITALDSSVLIALFKAEETAEAWSAIIESSRAAGEVVICDVVAAETGAAFQKQEDFVAALEAIEVQFSPMNLEASFLAGTLHRRCREKGGKKEQMVGDFLIGAHALLQADRLVTGDRGFMREHFSRLRIVSLK